MPFSYLGSTPKIFSFFGGLGVLLFQVRQVVFLVGVLAGAASIIYGAIRAIMAYRIRKQYLTLIDEIRAGKFNQ